MSKPGIGASREAIAEQAIETIVSESERLHKNFTLRHDNNWRELTKLNILSAIDAATKKNTEEMKVMNDRWSKLHNMLATAPDDDWDEAPFRAIVELQERNRNQADDLKRLVLPRFLELKHFYERNHGHSPDFDEAEKVLRSNSSRRAAAPQEEKEWREREKDGDVWIESHDGNGVWRQITASIPEERAFGYTALVEEHNSSRGAHGKG